VDVSWDAEPLGGLKSLVITDNGHGLPHADAETLFGRLGGSWKRIGAKTKNGQRWLHGHEGRGRFKAFALGRVVEWNVRYRAQDGVRAYKITMLGDDQRHVRVSDERLLEGRDTGVRVTITEVRATRFLDREETRQGLSEIFAIYLRTYGSVVLSISSVRLDPSLAVASQKRFDLPDIEADDSLYRARLDVIEWRGKAASERVLYLCNEHGFPLDRIAVQFHTLGYQFSAYLQSEYLAKLHDEGGLELPEMEVTLAPVLEAVRGRIKDYFQGRAARDASDIVETWKAENVYPFPAPPQNDLEEAEQKVFNIVAVRVNDALPELATAPRRTKAFQFRMLRQAIESSPADLQLILKEVLDLPERDRREFAELLERTSLPAIIGASKLVGDRLQFLSDLETMLFGEVRTHVLERSQLHRILADNTWVFGEEFALTGDDQGLTAILRTHSRLLGDKIAVDEPVLVPGGRRGIIDLMFSKVVKSNRQDEIQHLVVELKRPTKKIDAEEITQIKRYAQAVYSDSRFQNLEVRWDFWLIGVDLSEFAQNEAKIEGLPAGVIWRGFNGRVTAWCKSWAEVLQANKARLHFFQERLHFRVDRGANMEFLRRRYDELLRNLPRLPLPEYTDRGRVADAADLVPGLVL